MNEQIIEFIRKAPWEELGPVLQAAAGRINDHRETNGGMTPRPMFKPCIELGISYACVELVLWVLDSNQRPAGVMLKRRNAEDQGWEGQQHIPGRALLPFETLGEVQKRVIDEFTADNWLHTALETFFRRAPYVEVHREDPDRRVNCLTVVHQGAIRKESLPKLLPGFIYVPVEEFGNPSIVDHHRETLRNLHPVKE